MDGLYPLDATCAFPDFHEVGQLTLILNLLRNKDSEPLKEQGTHSLPSRSFAIIIVTGKVLRSPAVKRPIFLYPCISLLTFMQSTLENIGFLGRFITYIPEGDLNSRHLLANVPKYDVSQVLNFHNC